MGNKRDQDSSVSSSPIGTTGGAPRTQEGLDEQEFYEVMQQYRHASVLYPIAVADAFEAVKTFIRKELAGAPRERTPPPDEEISDVDLMVLTTVVREADQLFQTVGGSSRHWVRDCFWPLLAKNGLMVVRTPEPQYLKPLAARPVEISPAPPSEKEQDFDTRVVSVPEGAHGDLPRPITE